MPKPTPAQFDVFLAHNSADKPMVAEIAAKLRRRKITPWFDKDQIAPGRFFVDPIQEILPKVNSAAVFFGRTGLGRWQALELRTLISLCVEKNIPVIPVLLPGIKDLPDDWVFLKQLHWIRFRKSIKDPTAFNAMVWGITGTRN